MKVRKTTLERVARMPDNSCDVGKYRYVKSVDGRGAKIERKPIAELNRLTEWECVARWNYDAERWEVV